MRGDDLTGKTFGKLLVLECTGIIKNKNGVSQTAWRCKCSCGNIVDVPRCSLVTGNTKSCGCYKNEKLKECVKQHQK